MTSPSEKRELRSVSLDKSKIPQSNLESWLLSNKCKFKKSAMFNFMKNYQKEKLFGGDSIYKILSQDDQLSSLPKFLSQKEIIESVHDSNFPKNFKNITLEPKLIRSIALLISREIKLSGWLNEQYISKLFEVNSGEINSIFSFGESLTSKLAYFLNIRHKTETSEDEIDSLVCRIERFSGSVKLVSNLFCSVRKKKFTFSNLPDANLLLSNVLPVVHNRKSSLPKNKNKGIKTDTKKGFLIYSKNAFQI